MAEPKCPECGIEGIQHITSQESAQKSRGGDAWFEVAYCTACGHIYGVFPKIIYQATPPPAMPSTPRLGL
jgi:predicted  nucleic acid-binding Zn-ribbon protein